MLSFVNSQAVASSNDNKELNVREFILEHVSDSYLWHITTIGDRHISIPLPVIVYSNTTGWHVFMSSKFHGGHSHDGLIIATEGEYKGKIVEIAANGSQVKPFDISITKNVFSLLFSSLLLILIIMSVSRSYKKKGFAPKTGF
jgi:F-type H+-transporting ATPase subunit a